MIVKYRLPAFPVAIGGSFTARANLYCGKVSIEGSGAPTCASAGGAGAAGADVSAAFSSDVGSRSASSSRLASG